MRLFPGTRNISCALPAIAIALLRFAGVLALLWLLAGRTIQAQSARVRTPIDDSSRVPLAGNVSPAALAAVRAGGDLGPVPSAMPIRRMQLVLARSPRQEAALAALMDAQHDRGSASFHQWLTPTAFAAQFGPADEDLSALTGWLARHGFSGIQVNAGRTLIEFSGTAGSVQGAFHTSMHALKVSGETHYANLTDPEIPAALTPVVAGLASLNNLPRKAPAQLTGHFRRDNRTGAVTRLEGQTGVHAEATIASNNTVYYGISPYDFAAIYDVAPLWDAAAPIDGTGQTIAVVGDTDINPADFVAFRTLFGLPLGATTSQTGTQYLNIIYNGPQPAVKPDEYQADADTQWAAAVAKGAVIDYVASEATEASSGDDLSAAYIVDNNLAPILTYSADTCELALGTGGNAFYKALWQQAAAQGITVVTPAGDSGAAGCDPGHVSPALDGLAVNGLSSTPYNVSVGGTEFYTPGGVAQYFNAGNTSTYASAKGYIPEAAWNDTCTDPTILATSPYSGLTAEQACNSTAAKAAGYTGLAGSGGGASACTTSDGKTVGSCAGGYGKPAWQTGAGVPADGRRDTPDVALFASEGRTNSFYIVCQQDRDTDGQPCNLSYPYADFAAYGGTEIATPAFAGILALAAQQTGARLGNANYVLYPLAARQASSGLACNSTGTTSSGCVFHDITLGTNAMPCVTGSPNCTTATAGDPYGILAIAPAGTGYDLSTGLGSVDVTNLVQSWSSVALASTTAVLSLSPSSITHGSATTATVTVTSSAGTPTGQVSLNGQAGNGSVGSGTLAGGVLTQSFTSFPGGSYGVRAHYGGDGTFAAADSNFVSLTVNPEPSSTLLRTLDFNPITGAAPNVSSAPYGSVFYIRADVAGQSGQGIATGNVAITDNGVILGSGVYRLNSSGYTEAQNNSLTPGTHVFAASYAGDPSFHASTAANATLLITRAATTASVTATPATVSQGATVTFTATIATTSFGYLAPTGVVTFSSGNRVLGTSTLVQGTDAATFYDNGQATLTLSAGTFPLGSDPITVAYPGDGNYTPSTSPAAPLSVTGTTLIPTSTSVSAAPTTIAPAGTIVLSAAVTPLSPAPTGTVQFAIDGQNTGGTVSLSSGGLAGLAVSVSSLTLGTHAVTAVYSGDSTYRSSLSISAPFVIAAAGTQSVPVTSVNPARAVQGTFVAVGVQITPGVNATGTVQLILDGGPYGTAIPLAGAAATLPLATSTIQVGTHVLSVFYSGDATYSPSYAAPTILILSAPGITPSAVALSGLPALVAQGSPATFTATVNPTNPTPTGIFQIVVDGGNPGTPILLAAGAGALAVPTTNLALGSHTVAVFYSGDATYDFSTSAPVTFTVGPAVPSGNTGSFTLSPANASLTASRLNLFTTPVLSFAVTPNGGFSGPVGFSCANLPANTVCSFSPARVSLSGTTAGSTSLTVTLNSVVAGRSEPGPLMSAGVLVFASLMTLLLPCRLRRRPALLALFLLAFVCATVSGCGGGFSKNASPAGTFTFQVIAAGGGVTQSANVSLTIQ